MNDRPFEEDSFPSLPEDLSEDPASTYAPPLSASFGGLPSLPPPREASTMTPWSIRKKRLEAEAPESAGESFAETASAGGPSAEGSEETAPTAGGPLAEGTAPTAGGSLVEGTAPTSGGGTAPEPGGGTSAGAGFELIQVVGRGGMGEIWAARQSSLSRLVAVKTIKSQALEALGGDPSSRRAMLWEFEQEAVVAASLEHPNIVPVYDLGSPEPGAPPMLAMKLVRGAPWDKALKADIKEMSEADFLAKHLPILVDMGQAVAFAHARGIVHRDLKPGQVITGEFGEALLMDWGLAVHVGVEDGQASVSLAPGALDALPTPATASNPAGTPALMAPEQTRDTAAKIGTWTDVFLLGGTLYWILAGSYPFSAKKAADAFRKAAMGEFEPPSERAPGRFVPPELEELCLQALARHPRDRVPSAKAFVEGVQAYLSGASKRRESEKLAAEASQALAELRTGKAALAPEDVYARRDHASALLGRALALWPENPKAEEARAENLAVRIEEEIDHGDLILARVHLRQLEEIPKRTGAAQALAGKLDAAVREREKARFHRRLLAGLAMVLLAGAAALAWQSHRNATAAEFAEARRREEAARAELFQRLNRLRDAENVLAGEIRKALPLPRWLDKERAAIARHRLDLAKAEELIARRKELLKERRALASQGALFPEPSQLPLGEPNLELLRSESAEAMLRAAKLYEFVALERPSLSEPLIGLGVASLWAGYPTSATLHLDKAARVASEADGADSLEAAEAVALAAQAHAERDRFDDTHLKKRREALAKLEPEWTRMTLELAKHWEDLGEHEKAHAYAMPASGVAARLEGEEARHLEAEASDRAANALAGLDRPEEALEAATRSAEIRSKVLGEQHLETADSYRRLAERLETLGRADEARLYLQKAHDFYFQGLSEFDLAIRGVYPAQAAMLAAQGKHEEAEQVHRQAVELSRRVLGDKHPSTAHAIERLGQHLSERGDPEAEEHLREAVALRREIHGADHPDTLQAWRSLGSHIHGQEGREGEGHAILQHVADAHHQRLGADHPLTAKASKDLSVHAREAGMAAEAEHLHLSALDSLHAAHGKDHHEAAETLFHLGESLFAQGEYEKAEPILLLAMERLGATGRQDAERELAKRHLFLCLEAMKRESRGDVSSEALMALALDMGRKRAAARESEPDVPLLALWERDLPESRAVLLAARDLAGHQWLLVRAQALRTAALLRAAAPSEAHPAYAAQAEPTRALLESIEKLDPTLASRIANLPEPPAALASAGGPETLVDSARLEEWLDFIAPAPDWRRELPRADLSFDPASLGQGEALEADVDAILAERRDRHAERLASPKPWTFKLQEGHALKAGGFPGEAERAFAEALELARRARESGELSEAALEAFERKIQAEAE